MILAFMLAAAAAPRFDPLTFFQGRTKGAGRLRVAMRHAHAVEVHGRGRLARDGALLLQQTLEEPGKPSRMRAWRIRRIAPGQYAGTLTDARGPVTGWASGDELRLRYKASGGVVIEQRLVLTPGGRSARNRLTARKLGVVVAKLDETIRKLD